MDTEREGSREKNPDIRIVRPASAPAGSVRGVANPMPEISRFFGVLVRMDAGPRGAAMRPHIHAYWQHAECVLSLETLEPVRGELPRRQLRLLEAWVEIHQDELLTNWERLAAGRLPLRIDPLR